MKKNCFFSTALVCSLMLCFMYSSTLYAHEPPTPYIYTVCGNLPYHDLYSKGLASVTVNGKAQPQIRCCWQCVNCYMVVATQGEGMQPVGDYVMREFYEPISGNGAIIEATKIYHSDSNTLPDCRFNYYPYRMVKDEK